MGSLSRFSAIEKVVKAFETEILTYFKDLIGTIVGQLYQEDIEIEHWIGANIPLCGSPEWEVVYVHFRWATEEEYFAGEVKDEDIVSDFNKFIAGSRITSISVGGHDRDDEVYLYAHIDEYSSLEIPLGFNSETLEFYGFMVNVLSEEKRKSFIENYYMC